MSVTELVNQEFQELRKEAVGGFVVRVNGQEVWTTDDHVLAVSLSTARGQVGRVGMAPGGNVDTYIDVVVELTDPQGPRRLDEVEEVNRRIEQKRVESLELTHARPNSPEFVQETTALPGKRPSDGEDPGGDLPSQSNVEENKEATEQLNVANNVRSGQRETAEPTESSKLTSDTKK